MRNQNDICVLGATQINVGLSTTIRFIPGPFQSYARIAYLSGGSLEIVKAATATGWGGGYLMGTTEQIDVWGPATFYMVASGATAVVQVLIGATSGATLI